MHMGREYYYGSKIRQVVCLIFGIFVAALLTGSCVERGIERVEAKMEHTQKTLAKEVLRFHVLANSDSEEDQAVKMKVRDAVLVYMEESMGQELGDEPDAEETKEWVRSHLHELEDVADQTVADEGYSYQSRAEVEVSYFPDKQYGDVFFPQGEYEALKIRLGDARGHNWWCVLYPSLCFTDTACTVVSDEGKQGLKEVLTAEEYEMVTATSDFKIKWFFFGDGAKEE
ncbi:stage II sporulation protein R [Sporofaciens musculi]|jgi:stage II sporulation protein R|uniref:stage II sporulation protein R n=1 Tax=Sporofaciens musculi TaxID=2681861 RepID=UPI00216E8D49|nr:stage II sporulation protein R [Dorea sp.]